MLSSCALFDLLAKFRKLGCAHRASMIRKFPIAMVDRAEIERCNQEGGAVSD